MMQKDHYFVLFFQGTKAANRVVWWHGVGSPDGGFVSCSCLRCGEGEQVQTESQNELSWKKTF